MRDLDDLLIAHTGRPIRGVVFSIMRKMKRAGCRRLPSRAELPSPGNRTSPAQDATPPPSDTEETLSLDEEQIHLFLGRAKRESPYYALYYTAALTGMRSSELAGLSRTNLDLHDLAIYVRQAFLRVGKQEVWKKPKSKAGRRRIAITEHLAHVLRDVLAEQDRAKEISAAIITITVSCSAKATASRCGCAACCSATSIRSSSAAACRASRCTVCVTVLPARPRAPASRPRSCNGEPATRASRRRWGSTGMCKTPKTMTPHDARKNDSWVM
jgi:integrase